MNKRIFISILIGFIVFCGVTAFVVRHQFSMVQNELVFDAEKIVQYINLRTKLYESVLEGFASHIGSQDGIKIAQIRNYVRHLKIQYPVIYMMEISQRVSHDDKTAFEKRMQESGHPHFKIHNFGYETDRKFHPPSKKDHYYPIVFMEPELPEAEGVLGLDLAETSSILISALQRSARLGRQVASLPFDLIEDQRGYVLYQPVLSQNSEPANQASLTAPYYALLVVKGSSLLPDLAGSRKGLSVSIWASDSTNGEELNVYSTKNEQIDNAITRSIFPSFKHALRIDSDSQPLILRFDYEMGWKDIHIGFVGGSLGAVIFIFLATLWISSVIYRREINARQLGLQKAEEANQAKSQFLSRMSHELRTPLNAILGFAQILDMNENKSLGPEEKKGVKEILKGGWHLLEVVNDLLDLTTIEANKIELQMERVDLLERLQDSLDVMQPLAQQREITIHGAAACAEIFVQADPVRLKQVLLNLLSNAVKYNRKGGSVTLSCELVDTATVRISITDTGSGIPEADIPTLFDPFSRLYLDTHAQEGTGIGLTIAKQLVELMGGHIGVTSELGHGSTFWIELPLSHSPAQAISAAITPSAESSDAVVAETTLLYVEDSPSHIHLVEAIIENMKGIRLLSAHTPMLGLELAQAHRPDLIMLDICLPGMDGFEVFEQLRANEVTREIPVIAVSANAMPLDIEKGLRAGFRRYLTKPINVTEFKKAVDELLRDSATLSKSDS